MTQPATLQPLTPRERLRWRRAMDTLLMDAIYGRVVRDTSPEDDVFVTAGATIALPVEPSISIA